MKKSNDKIKGEKYTKLYLISLASILAISIVFVAIYMSVSTKNQFESFKPSVDKYFDKANIALNDGYSYKLDYVDDDVISFMHLDAWVANWINFVGHNYGPAYFALVDIESGEVVKDYKKDNFYVTAYYYMEDEDDTYEIAFKISEGQLAEVKSVDSQLGNDNYILPIDVYVKNDQMFIKEYYDTLNDEKHELDVSSHDLTGYKHLRADKQYETKDEAAFAGFRNHVYGKDEDISFSFSTVYSAGYTSDSSIEKDAINHIKNKDKLSAKTTKDSLLKYRSWNTNYAMINGKEYGYVYTWTLDFMESEYIKLYSMFIVFIFIADLLLASLVVSIVKVKRKKKAQ